MINDNNLFVFTLILLSNQTISEQRKLYRCLNSTTHKKYPSSENNLFNQCSAWNNLSCCTEETSLRLHSLNVSENSLYNLKFNQCPERNLSEQCRQYFIDDLCFYQCSPYNLPWIINSPMRVRNERLHKVPLCKSECDAWFQACQHDYTCSDNWVKNFIWDKNGNHCLKDFSCLTVTDIFGSANKFCEKIWDDSWKVVDDSTPCMKLRVTNTEHNKFVGIHYAKKLSLLTSSVNGYENVQFILLLTLSLIFTQN